MSGIIYGVSTGPGDPELMTLKAVNIVKEAQVVAYPVDKSGKSVALSIAEQAVDLSGKELIGLHFPMTRDEEKLQAAWNDISDKMAAALDEGKNIAFLNLGDVSLFSTWGYLRQKLTERGYETKSVAGVTAMCAVAAALDRDLTTRDEALTIIPASISKEELDKYMDLPGNKVVMKAGKSLNEMLEELGYRDLLEQSAMGINCGLPGEQLYPSLKDVDDVEGYFATILI